MKALFATIIFMWAVIGVILAGCSRSRGVVADMIFIVTWPWHLIRHMRGEE